MNKQHALAMLLMLGLLAACAPPAAPAANATPTREVERELNETGSSDQSQSGQVAVDEDDQRATPATIAIPDAEFPKALDDNQEQATDQAPFSAPNPTKRLMVERARGDLAQQLDLSPSAIEVIEVQEVQWPDAGLGCPQPDGSYAQVITPGYRILLKAGAQFYRYHTDEKNHFYFCSGDARLPDGTFPLLPAVPVKPGDIDDGVPWVPVN